MKPIHVGLLGFGTVGQGTWNVLRRNQGEIQRRAGRPIEINWIGTARSTVPRRHARHPRRQPHQRSRGRRPPPASTSSAS